jgi:hypothetical protein
MTTAMTPSEMIYEAMNDLLFRFNNLKVGTLRAAVDGCTDLDELRFFRPHIR